MKVIIAGSRDILTYGAVETAVELSGFEVTETVSGHARGVDMLGEMWAEVHGVPCTRFPADWKHLGRAAGIVRNQEMAFYADALVAVWDGKSRGTKFMIEYMRDKMMKPTYVFTLTLK